MKAMRTVDRETQPETVTHASTGACDAAMKPGVPARVRAGLMLLLESLAYAHDVSEDIWEFSVEWSELRRFGMTSNDARWLICKGLVQYARETTSAEDAKRTFVSCKAPSLNARTCLILTEKGIRLTRHLAVSPPATPQRSGQTSSFHESLLAMPDGNASQASTQQPVWDSTRRELRVGGRIVKEFKVPAPNQEMVLDVFEEESWSPRIDDPLPPRPGITPQRRLHDTINSLNRNQRYRLVRFLADGLGKGVRWELVEDSLATA